MNFKKLGIIIQREYLNKVKKKSFLLITFLAPVLFAGIAILPSLIMLGAKEEAKQVGVIDRSGIVLPYLTDNDVTIFKDLGADANPDAIKADFGAAGVDVLLSISELDTVARTVQADCYSEKPLGMDTGEMIENRINDAVEAYRIESYGIENLEEIMAGVKSNVHLRSYTIDESGIYMALSMILGMALYMFIALFSGMVMSSVIEEKSSRVVEVLMSSVKATELMFGKIIGIALVALTQFLLWILLSGVIIGAAGGIMKDKLIEQADPAELAQSLGVSPDQLDTVDFTQLAGTDNDLAMALDMFHSIPIGKIIIIFLVFFLFGYLLYASLFAAIGSAVENAEDTQQLQIPLTVPLMLGYIIALYAFKAPDSSIAFWASMFPFTSPIVMIARLPFGVPGWEIAVSLGLLILTFVVCAWASAKIYKVGILMFGKKSSWKDLWKWLKQN